MATKIYKIDTCMGKYIGSNLSFLTSEELEEFNNIGYTGKDFKGRKSSYERFLNEINKGEFTVKQTKSDNGDFCESFIIARTVIEKRTDENIPTEDEVIDTIMNCVDIRGIDLEDYRFNFSNERSGLYDAMLKLFNVKK